MENVNIPEPNPFITNWLLSPECRSLVFDRAQIAEALYREVVAKRTGRLATSTHVTTGIEDDRWVALMTAYAPYAASHEFGTDDGDLDIRPGAHEMNHVLDMLGSL
jgi:hypothetical protein